MVADPDLGRRGLADLARFAGGPDRRQEHRDPGSTHCDRRSSPGVGDRAEFISSGSRARCNLRFCRRKFRSRLTASWTLVPAQSSRVRAGLAGASNIGVVLDSLLAPRLATAYGWRTVFGLAVIPAVVVLVIYVLVSRGSSADRSSAQTVNRLSCPCYVIRTRIGSAFIIRLVSAVLLGSPVRTSSSLRMNSRFLR